jgi:hypothetical protein
MKWIVLKENPKSDGYIPVIVTDEIRTLRIETRPCYVFFSSEQALQQARLLQKEYRVHSIKIFYSDSATS